MHKIKNLKDQPQNKYWRKLTDSGYSDQFQSKWTKELLEKANLFIHDQFCDNVGCQENCGAQNYFQLDLQTPFGSIDTHNAFMNQYLNTLGQYLVIIDAADVRNHIFIGDHEDLDEPIYIEWLKGDKTRADHFNFIRYIEAYTKAEYFCYACHIAHGSVKHQCEGICPVCKGVGKCKLEKDVPTVDCDGCGRTCFNQNCYTRHLDTPNGPHCSASEFCKDCCCVFRVNKKAKHVCGEYKCPNCYKKYTETPHYCMLKPLNVDKLVEEDKTNKIIVCYDIESCLVKDERGNDLHKPMLLISGIKYQNNIILIFYLFCRNCV